MYMKQLKAHTKDNGRSWDVCSHSTVSLQFFIICLLSLCLTYPVSHFLISPFSDPIPQPPTQTHIHTRTEACTGSVRWSYACPNGVPITSPEIRQHDLFSVLQGDHSHFSFASRGIFHWKTNRFSSVLFGSFLMILGWKAGLILNPLEGTSGEFTSFCPCHLGACLRGCPQLAWRMPREGGGGDGNLITVCARGWERRRLGVEPGTCCGDSSRSKVGKAADGDLPLRTITEDI